MAGRAWTEEERRRLEQLVTGGASDAEIATVLRRTERAVTNQRQVLGMVYAGGRPWAAVETKRLERAYRRETATRS